MTYWYDEVTGKRGIDLMALHDDLESQQMWHNADDWTPNGWSYSSERDLRDKTRPTRERKHNRLYWSEEDNEWIKESWSEDLDINPKMGVNASGSAKGGPPPKKHDPIEMFNLCNKVITDPDLDKSKSSHYIAGNDPFRFATDNNLNVLEFSIIKYVTRHSRKNGKEDLEKARHVLDRLINEYYGG